MFVFTPINQFKRDLKKLNKQSKLNETLISTFLNQLQKEGVNELKKNIKSTNLPVIIRIIGKPISNQIY